MIYNDSKWRYREKESAVGIYQLEHERLFASIRGGKAENDGEYMSKSTLLAIMNPVQDFTAPKAQRSMHGICTKPATGSQVMPR